MKALCVKQPWAHLIASGRKRFEIRSWRTNYRGPLAIVASKGADRDGVAFWGDGPRSQVVAVANLVDCRPFMPADAEAACCEWDMGLYVWELADVRPGWPGHVSGRLGIFELDAEQGREPHPVAVAVV